MPEESVLRAKLMDAILGVDPNRSRVWLPGSQPVSLDASNKSLLSERQYWCARAERWGTADGDLATLVHHPSTLASLPAMPSSPLVPFCPTPG